MVNEVSQGYRLSPQQRQAWAAGQAGAPPEARCAVRVEGVVRADQLEAALRELVERHDVLRTRFQTLPGMRFPVQVVEDGGVSWEHAELSDVAHDEQERLVARLFEQAGGDEGEARLRASLVTLSGTRHVLFISVPQLAADARTFENLTAELARLYASRAGGSPEEADEPVQYVQFSEWQNELFEDESDEEAAEGRRFWRENLPEGEAPRLPSERAAHGARFEPARASIALGEGVWREADAIGRAEGADAEAALLAGWHAALWHLLRHERIAVSRTFEGRKFEELRGALGLYDAELPVGALIEEEAPFGRLVRQVGERLRDGNRWQEYFPWFTVEAQGFGVYGFEYEAEAHAHAAGPQVFRLADSRTCATRFKLKLRCVRRGSGLTAELHYDAALFAREEAERIGRRYARLLSDAVADPRTPVGRLTVVDEEERARLLKDFDGAREQFDEACFHELFEAQAARTPDTAAVVCEGEQLTYAELNRRANQLARRLIKLGAKPETRIALLAERSANTVVNLLAVLKTGAAYVPLDPALPAERLGAMLRDAGVALLLCEREGDAPEGVAHLSLDADARAIASESDENPRVAVDAANLAYVIYTSGSTGRPKGVAVAHGQLSNYVNSIRRQFELPAPAAYAVVSTLAADLGHTMTFPALAAGGTLHVITHEVAADARALSDYFARHRIDCLKIVPSHLAALLASDESGGVLPRRRLVIGGEAASPELVERIRRLAPGCRLFNHYGPTETTVGVLTHEVTAESADAGATPPLGRAIANTRVYVLDGAARLVPFGTPGELYVGGACVARGYLNHAAATAERFVPDPLSGEPGARLYRTGDVVRYLDGGELEFLGRIDNQVKIRGYRIELGEIEAAVRRHAAVRECVVVARAAGEERRVVAYVVAHRGRQLTAAELRASAHEWLPDYMMPSAFVLLDKLPLTSNGKLDARALPAPEEAQARDARPYVAPRNALEEALAGLWAEVLGCERVGVEDNFLELGGHSLLAMRITSRLRELFRVELPLRALFEATTVAELARALCAAEAKSGHFEQVARVLLKIKAMGAEGVQETLRAKKS